MRSPVLNVVGMFVAAGCARQSAPDATTRAEPTCAATSAISIAQYTGTSLPPKTLALTLDDGPGSRTTELSAYLASEGIQAGFFVVGASVAKEPLALGRLVADGHLVANHTEAHRDLTSFAPDPAGNAALEAEVSLNDARIAPFVPAARFLFRAPFGAWSAHASAVVQAGAMVKYVGPIRWDIGGARTANAAADWACWQDTPKLTTKACGDLYLAEIGDVGRGIVLMHDADNGDITNHALTSGVGNTVDMIRYLVPLLKARGYTFVRVDQVPAIAADLPPSANDGGANPTDASSSDADAGTSPLEPDAPRRPNVAEDAATNPTIASPPDGHRDPCRSTIDPNHHAH